MFWNDIRAWAFPTSSKVDIYCNLHVCPSECPFYQCRRLSRREAAVSALGPFADSAEGLGPSAPDPTSDAAVLPLQGSFEVSLPSTAINVTLNSLFLLALEDLPVQ